MKVNNRSIIITDPCYLDGKDKWYDGYEDDLSNHGFTDNIKEGTLYGDWSCTTFQTRNPNIKNITELGWYARDVANENINNANDEVIGQFCADGGEVCVVYRDEVLKINPNFEINECYYGSHYDENGKFIRGEKIQESTYNRLATLIKDFTGEINVFDFDIEDTTYRSLCGFGNINFYTLQTGY